MKVLSDPCFFEGYTTEYNGYTLVGTGDAGESASQIRRLIYSADGSSDTPMNTVTTQDRRIVGGMKYP